MLVGLHELHAVAVLWLVLRICVLGRPGAARHVQTKRRSPRTLAAFRAAASWFAGCSLRNDCTTSNGAGGVKGEEFASVGRESSPLARQAPIGVSGYGARSLGTVPHGSPRPITTASSEDCPFAAGTGVGGNLGLSSGAYLNSSPLTVEIFTQDVRFRRVGRRGGIGGKRGKVTGLSAGAARRFRFSVVNAAVDWVGLVHLTYPAQFPSNGREVKAHLHRFLLWLNGKGVRWAWVQEFQERGAPHFHVLVSGWLDRKGVARKWFEIVGSGDRKHLFAGTRVEGVRSLGGVSRYLGKYLAKEKQKTPPAAYVQCGRFWGISRGLVTVLHTWVAFGKAADRAFRTVRQYAERRAGKVLRYLHKGRCGMTLFRGVAVAARLEVAFGLRC